MISLYKWHSYMESSRCQHACVCSHGLFCWAFSMNEFFLYLSPVYFSQIFNNGARLPSTAERRFNLKCIFCVWEFAECWWKIPDWHLCTAKVLYPGHRHSAWEFQNSLDLNTHSSVKLGDLDTTLPLVCFWKFQPVFVAAGHGAPAGHHNGPQHYSEENTLWE